MYNIHKLSDIYLKLKEVEDRLTAAISFHSRNQATQWKNFIHLGKLKELRAIVRLCLDLVVMVEEKVENNKESIAH